MGKSTRPVYWVRAVKTGRPEVLESQAQRPLNNNACGEVGWKAGPRRCYHALTIGKARYAAPWAVLCSG